MYSFIQARFRSCNISVTNKQRQRLGGTAYFTDVRKIMAIYSPLSEFLQSPDICYVSVMYDPPETFRYDFHIFTSIDHYLSA